MQKILIIEDESGIRETLSLALSRFSFETIEAETGSRGIKLIREQTDISLVILDLGLPDTEGTEILKQIRQHSQLPVLILTARSDETDTVLGLELGADDYMAKPFSTRELSARVRAILRRSSNSVENRLFRHDEQANRIYFREKPLDLSLYEYRILALLLSHPGWVYSRDKIMQMIWEDPGNSFDRTVDTHIKNLRNKLKVIDPESEPIQTHRGLGYSIRDHL